MPVITEIAPDVYRISTYLEWANLEFMQFLVKDDEPLLFHTGFKSLFPDILSAVQTIIDPTSLRWISFSHFEADESCTLNEWLEVAPSAEPLCSLIGKIVSIDDFATRPARSLAEDEVLNTGKYRFRYINTPHVPHAWDAGLLFEETNRVLFCSDIFQQSGKVPEVTQSDVVGPMRESLLKYQTGPLAYITSYTQHSDEMMQKLANLRPKVCAAMHGSTYIGDGDKALRDAAVVLKEVYG